MFHPADYPYHGVRAVVQNDAAATFDRLYRPADGGVVGIVEQIAQDIESGVVGV